MSHIATKLARHAETILAAETTDAEERLSWLESAAVLTDAAFKLLAAGIIVNHRGPRNGRYYLTVPGVLPQF